MKSWMPQCVLKYLHAHYDVMMVLKSCFVVIGKVQCYSSQTLRAHLCSAHHDKKSLFLMIIFKSLAILVALNLMYSTATILRTVRRYE